MGAQPSTLPLLTPSRLKLLECVARILATNPFDPGWEALLEDAIEMYVPGHDAGLWQRGVRDRNLETLSEPLVIALVGTAGCLQQGVAGTPRELAAYTKAAIWALWDEAAPGFERLVDEDGVDAPFYEPFAAHHHMFFGAPRVAAPDPAHLFAVLYQAHRARCFISSKIRGASPSVRAARASIWRASLGSDLLAYAYGLYRRMEEIPVLVTGETGTGKELAAQCIGGSRYIPFEAEAKRFVARYAEDYHARNLCEVPRELVESTLFGHRKGAFTGASGDATGYLALPGPHGTLFLDEIGELPEHAQVKLLRPLEGREYVPIGEIKPRKIHGRHVFATRRDLEAMCAAGTFREDLYERMHRLGVHMPPLRQMLAEDPGELTRLVRGFVAEQIDAPEQVERWTARVTEMIRVTLPGYRWPRNVRELRNLTERFILTDGAMSADAPRPPVEPRPEVAGARPPGGTTPSTPTSTCLPSSGLLGPVAKQGNVTIEELERAYVTRVYALTGQNRSETSRRTGLNWRTIGRRIDPVRLARWILGKPEKDEPEQAPKKDEPE